MQVQPEHVDAVRRFTRFYTRRIGVLHEGLLGSPFSLAEGRVLYEVAQRDGVTAAELGKDLGLDAGYLSRILRGFEDKELIARRQSRRDGRQSLLSLTPPGREAFAAIDARSREEVSGLIAPLADIDRAKLVAALRTVEGLLAPDPAR